MPEAASQARRSIFAEAGVSKTLEALKQDIAGLYQEDNIPWVIGYSGGKDSTSVVQLVWLAVSELPAEQRTKPVYVITTDTLVENPVVASWVNHSLKRMEEVARSESMPFHPNLLRPDLKNTFWVNLIGKGYPAPRPKFRWCTERLKIKPSNRFIQDTVSEHGEVVLLLGARRAESAARAGAMNRAERASRDQFTYHQDLPNTLVHMPIGDWSNDDVWTFLMRVKNPWGVSNKDLMSMYRGATEDNECPVVVDTSTPSCGNSRFGCWTCTLVDKDKSMGAMIQNDHEKEWMMPLLDIRNELDFRGEEARQRDLERRDFRRMGGHLQYYRDQDGEAQLIPGPYTQEAREHWLSRVLAAQRKIRDDEQAPDYVQELELISLEELEEIRRIWITEKHEVEDLVPRIYIEEMGEPYPGAERPVVDLFEGELLELLKEACDGNRVRYETARNLLAIERRYQYMGARRGLFKELEKALRNGCFETKKEALEFKRREAEIEGDTAGACAGRQVGVEGESAYVVERSEAGQEQRNAVN
ncbi:DNA phosphorothioation system sulfurtransferase DndC [Spectribacter hydrogenoxidans]|uniref:DNA phosphorothioation system sulfurtransferase DndC n=1 Tax=Spectribacter hydrogenoxidans TaxID=3075608 RepID=A0ABU3C0J2_9GAMM|nr:DNA phosphorothioation system sulfurtransferase DndC [Salinisphaera sp. W335]MDT0634881.1 DNA phosphorothioation system sulfurtransferase DndC [Salinisphaera sp. W335]